MDLLSVGLLHVVCPLGTLVGLSWLVVAAIDGLTASTERRRVRTVLFIAEAPTGELGSA